jgi:hypothetical protein
MIQQQARVKALRGEGKTVSRKARKSGRASGTASPGGADLLSKVFQSNDTPYHSESEASGADTPPAIYDGADGEWMDEQLPSREDIDRSDGASFDPKALISELQDRKNNQKDLRELLLDRYVKMLRNIYADNLDVLDDNADELVEVFLRAANRGDTPRERSLSLQAYYLTASVTEVGKIDAARALLKQICSDDDNENCQIQALYALSVTVAYSSGSKEEILDFLDFLVQIIESNGDTINALDKDNVIVAAFECWAFAATHVDLWEQADYAMDTFADKLDSNDSEIQAIASECIALIFEASRAHEDEEGEPFQLPYDPQRVAGRVQGLSKGAVKSMSRKDRRDLRESLRSVVTSLERGVGPYYSTATQYGDNTSEFGYRFKIRRRDASGGQYQALVESWHYLHRIRLLRNLFQGGMDRQMEHDNPLVLECLEGLEWQPVYRAAH